MSDVLVITLQERNDVFQSLRTKAQLVTEELKQVNGIECNPVQGAMYAFPRINIPEKARVAAMVSPVVSS